MTPRHDYEAPAGHGEWDALAVGWAMSALDPDDEAIFLPHLANCDQCAQTVAETTQTVGDIAWVVPSEAPPPELRNRLMSAVLSEPRVGGSVRPPPAPYRPSGPSVPPRVGEPPHPSHPAADPAERGRHAAPGPDVVVPFRRRQGGAWRAVAAAAAVFALLAGLGAWNVKLRSDENQLRDVVARRNAVIQEFLKGGQARVVPLNSPSGERVATVVARPNGTDVITESLPPNGADARYWLWATNSPTPVAIGGFDVSATGFSAVSLGRSGLDSIGSFAVSREPGQGTPTKPTNVVANGQSN